MTGTSATAVVHPPKLTATTFFDITIFNTGKGAMAGYCKIRSTITL
jgi:hypothetical protein